MLCHPYTDQKKSERAARDPGATLYDAAGDLMEIEGITLQGRLTKDRARQPSAVNNTNFMSQLGFKAWWHSMVYGDATEDSSAIMTYVTA